MRKLTDTEREERRLKRNAAARQKRKENPEKASAIAKRSYDKHRAERQAHGREANRKRRAEDPEYDRIVARRYRKNNPEKVKVSSATYRATHKTERAEALKAWHAANPNYEKERDLRRNAENPQRHAQQYAKNKDRMASRAAQWRKDNPVAAREILNRSAHKRRAAKRGSTEPHYTLKQIRDLRTFTANRCVYCGFVGKLTIDHVVPLARGGSNGISNIQLICRPCNSAKQDRDPLEFARSMGMFLWR